MTFLASGKKDTMTAVWKDTVVTAETVTVPVRAPSAGALTNHLWVTVMAASWQHFSADCAAIVQSEDALWNAQVNAVRTLS
jgi:hypothetical protein